MGTMTVPKGDLLMWGIGLRLTWPPCEAVGSPPILATKACAASWHVVEKRKTMYQIAPSTRKCGLGIRADYCEMDRDATIEMRRFNAGSAREWLRGLDSNQDSQIQSLMCYRLHHPGTGK